VIGSAVSSVVERLCALAIGASFTGVITTLTRPTALVKEPSFAVYVNVSVPK